MNPSARSAIRDDVLADYQEPRPGLTVRVLRVIPDHPHRLPSPTPPQRGGEKYRRGAKYRETARVALQTLAVIMAAVVVGVAVVGFRVSRGEIALPSDMPFGIGGLHPPAASYSIVDNQFISAEVGWIVAQLYEHNGPTVLMGTTDGGQTWHEQFRIPDGDGIDYVHFWNARDGEIAEDVPSTLPPTKTPGAPGSSNMVPRVYRTSDGGNHWQLIDRPIDWANIVTPSFFLTPQEGWRLSGEPLQSSERSVQHTADGGDHWTTLTTIKADLLGGQLTFRDSQNGWIVASQETGTVVNAAGQRIPAGIQKDSLWATHDGGLTWARQDLPLPATGFDVYLSTPLFFNGKDGLLPVAVQPRGFIPPYVPGQPLTQLNKAYVLQTHDGGLHWGDLVETQGAVPDGAVFFLDAKHWLTADGPSLTETFDAGKTWTASRQVLANGLSFSFGYWNYVNSQVIWAQVGASMLVKSTDGGAHWAAVNLPVIK